ncbi:MAG TPA: SIS domain-containing protein [Anaerolineales bacterium]|nr:SIS domain-containing protein [Anaerolineales bacterium]
MTVWNDIVSQVDNLRLVVEKHAAMSSSGVEKAAALLRSAGNVCFAGVGSGLNATIPAYAYLMGKGIASQYIDATELTYDLFPGVKRSALVLNTRSGETVELIKLAKMARKSGIPTIAVTNEPESTVGRMVDVCIPTYSRWDELVVLSAYGGMAATELILASHVAGEQEAMFADLRAAMRQMQPVFSRALENRDRASVMFELGRPIYLLGRGASYASTLTGTLVLEEMARQHAIPMSGGLFRQGPIEVVDDGFRAILFEGAGETALLMQSLGRDLIASGAQVYWIGSTELHNALNLNVPSLPAHVLPLLEAIPLHMLAFDLAQKQGYEPGTVRYIQKVITTETGLPNQNETR